ncbi:MAG: SCP2 sterol-binding domain-containing protein [Candidatus Geothermincolia bacterium]
MTFQYGTDEWEQEYKKVVAENSKTPPPYIYFTPEWVALFEQTIQQDPAYREAAKDWEGTVVLHVEPDSEHGLDFDLYVYMDLWHGDCRSIRIVPASVGEAGDFIISGSMERWTQVGKGELDAVKGMMQGKLKLKGDLPTIVRAVRSAQRLTEISAEVGGNFPTELSQEEIQVFRGINNELAAEFLGVGATTPAT